MLAEKTVTSVTTSATRCSNLIKIERKVDFSCNIIAYRNDMFYIDQKGILGDILGFMFELHYAIVLLEMTAAFSLVQS